MNREIKFRVWDKVDYMSSPFTLYDIQEKKIEFTKYCVVMQFTGLVDKNKNEIFEGDIVTNYKRLYEVAINFNGFYLQGYKLWRGEFKPAFTYSMSLITKPFKRGERGEKGGIVESAEVIGNIYQNPELLHRIKEGLN